MLLWTVWSSSISPYLKFKQNTFLYYAPNPQETGDPKVVGTWDEVGEGEKKIGKQGQVWEETGIIYRGIWTEVCNNGGWEQESNHQQVPDARRARTSQDTMGMRLAEMPYKGEGEPVETISSWGMGPPPCLQIFNPELFLSKGHTGTKCGAVTEAKAIQRLPQLGIHRIYRHQTQTLLQMLRSTCWQEPHIAVSWEVLPEPDKYRGGCTQPNLRLSRETPVEELGEGLKELKGLSHRNTILTN